jgi:hypothetical protein
MSTTVGYYQYRRSWLREAAAKAAAEGEARGEGRAVLTVLEARGVQVPTAIREHVLGCTDLDQLDTWLRRAATATTAEDVIHG